MARIKDTTYRKTIMPGLVSLPALLLCLIQQTALAQVAAPTFGKLFTTPEERAYLDYLRQDYMDKSQADSFDIDEDFVPEIPASEAPQAPRITEYSFGGVMTRVNGNRTIWLNGTQIRESDLPENMTLLATVNGIQLRIRANGADYLVKPGQTINIQNGVIANTAGSPATPENFASEVAGDNAESGDTQNSAAAEATSPANPPAGDGVQIPDSFQALLEQLDLDPQTIDPQTRDDLLEAYEQARAMTTDEQ